jgi:hypothetical protein
MRLVIAFIFLGLAGISLPLKAGNDSCGLPNMAFRSGESLTYKVYYSVAGAYLGVGEAVFSYTLEPFSGKDTYHAVAEGKTYSFYDNIYKVRDRYESYIDTATLLPYKFIRNVSEGSYKIYENVTFVKSTNTAVTSAGVYKTPDCVQDVVSSIAYTRNLDFSHLKQGDTVPYDMFMDKEVHHLSITYLGKEIIRTRYAKFRAIKFRSMVIKSNVFAGSEKMTVWISDDPNHIALRVESPIIIGKIKVDMMQYKNLRYPLSSLVDL